MVELTQMMRQRLKSISDELVDLDRRRQKLLSLKQTIEAAILQEDALSAARSVSDMSGVMPDDNPDGVIDDEEATAPSPKLSELVLAALADGPKNLDQLKEILAPQLGGEVNGRAINFALVGLHKGGHVQRNAITRSWRLPPSAK